MNITFKEYLDSKTQLIEALGQTPSNVLEYEIRKYCSISTGVNKDAKQVIGLKPKQKIIIEWLYEDINNPKVTTVCFKGVNDINEGQEFKLFWSSDKTRKWLSKNTKEGLQNGL